MQHLEVSCAVQPIRGSLGVKWLKNSIQEELINWQAPQIQMHDHFSLQDNFKETYYNYKSYMNFFTHNSPTKAAPSPHQRIFL